MRQTSTDQQDRLVEQRFRSELDNVRRKLETRLETLEAPSRTALEYTASPNLLPNSQPEWSKDAFLNTGITPTTAGDDNRECYNWYRQLGVYDAAPATTLAATDAAALKRAYAGAEHSLWAANEAVDDDIPIWDGVNGNFLLGSNLTNWDIACPLPTDFVSPGQRYFVYLEVSLAAADTDKGEGQQLYCGFWDNTAGQRKWIEGDDFTPTATVYGVAGTRTLEYKILAETDSGTQILSNVISVTTAPATLSEANHVRLAFTGAPGFIYYGIYRKDGSVYRLVHEIRNSIDLQFYDMQETAGSIESGWPSITTQRPQAFAKTTEFEPGELSSTAFTSHTLSIQVPLTYDAGNTTGGNQWFRFGLDANVGAGSERGIVIRRICLSDGYGTWTRSSLDLQAASSPTSRAASAPPSGNPTGDPPDTGGGGINCVTLDTDIEVVSTEVIEGERRELAGSIPMDDLQKGDYVSCGALSLPVQKVKVGTVQFVYEIETENGKILRCSDSHRIITSRFDHQGKAAKFLNVGDFVLTSDNGFKQSRIIRKVEILGETMVKSITLPKPHLFVTNGIVGHNNKNPELVV